MIIMLVSIVMLLALALVNTLTGDSPDVFVAAMLVLVGVVAAMRSLRPHVYVSSRYVKADDRVEAVVTYEPEEKP